MSDKKVIVKAVAKEAAPAVKAAPKKPLYNPKGDVLISVKNLDKTFKGTIHAVRNISTDIHKGEVVVLIGPSGSGKSTFLRCLNLLEVPTGGSITMDGVDIMDKNADLNKHRQKVGMVFQHFNLFDNLNVIQNMTIAPTKLKGESDAAASQRAMNLLDRVGLADRAEAYPSQLSGGQKQRIAIAGVLAMRPQCIVLDEATAMLDPIGRSEVISTIERLNRDEGITVVLITHHMNEAEHADRVIVMNEGRVAMDGAPREVFAQVERLRAIGLTVPDTVELLYELRGAGCDLPLTAITVDECADAIARCFGKSAKEDN